MDLKRLITHCTYRIEPKPEGGFIARPSDPTLAPLEAATREQLQQKIQGNILNTLTTEFPGLKLPLGKHVSYAFHIESKPGGGFAIHSAAPGTKTIEANSHAEIENHFAEKVLDFVGKQLTPDLAKALMASGGSRNVQISLNTEVASNVDLNSKELKLAPLTAFTSEASAAKPSTAKSLSSNAGTVGTVVGDSPITPEAGNWNFFRLLLALLVIAGVIYFFLHHR